MTTINAVNSPISVQSIETHDIETTLMMLALGRARNSENVLAMKLAEIKEKQATLENLTNALAKIKAMRQPDDNKNGWVWIDGDAYNAIKAANVDLSGIKGVVEENKSGKMQFTIHSQAAFDAVVAAINAKVDNLNALSQTDMITLQRANNMRNEAFELCTNWIKKIFEGRGAVVRNF